MIQLFASLALATISFILFPQEVGPRHHGMARPQVAGLGTACNMEGSCQYIE
jgi:hypothetical protein